MTHAKVWKELALTDLARVLVRAPAGLCWTLAIHWICRIRQIVLRGEWKERNYQDMIGVWGRGLSWIMGLLMW